MDPLAFLSWQFVMFSLFVATIMYVLRTILEFFIPKLTVFVLWNSLLLMILPVFIGAGLGRLLTSYPFANGFTTITEHVGYGAVAGLLSTVLFKVIKELLIGKVSGVVNTVLNTVGATPPVGTSPVVVVNNTSSQSGPNDSPPAGTVGMGTVSTDETLPPKQ